MIEYEVHYHSDLRNVIATGIIAVPEDAATPLEDAANQALEHAREIHAAFCVISKLGTRGAETGVFWLAPAAQVTVSPYYERDGIQ